MGDLDIEKLEDAMLAQTEQVECPLTHRFSDGVYVREIFMPQGTFVLGAEHKTKHLNVILMGRARVLVDGEVKEIRAPYTFESEAGVRKVLYILEDMIWQTIHVNADDERNVEQLEARLVNYTKNALKHKEMEKLLS